LKPLIRAALAFLPALALGVLGSAGAADAQGEDAIFAAFHQACMETGAEPAAVTAAAQAHGWQTGEAAGQTLPGFDVTNKVSEARKIGDADLNLFSWTGKKGPITASECQMQASAADFAAIKSAAAASLGFAPAESAPDKVVFHYTGGATPHAITDNSQFDAAAGGGGLYLLTLSSQGRGAFLELLTIRK
jgi:hypothetical protein